MSEESTTIKVTAFKGGPLVVQGEVEVTKTDGTTEIRPRGAFCRCGLSTMQPFCDGAHKQSDFDV